MTQTSEDLTKYPGQSAANYLSINWHHVSGGGRGEAGLWARLEVKFIDMIKTAETFRVFIQHLFKEEH